MFFKKLLAAALSAAMMISLFACTPSEHSPSPTADAPDIESTPSATVPVEKEGEQLLKLDIDTPTEIDLDADGKAETVSLSLKEGENLEDGDYEEALLTVTTADGKTIGQSLASLFYDIDVYFAKLDSSDAWSIIYTYEHSSSDYDTVFLRYKKESFERINCVQYSYGEPEADTFLFGMFDGFSENGNILFTETKDIIGTYVTTREYSLQADMIRPVDNTNWIIPSASSLKVKAELPVTLSDGTQSKLAVGTEIEFTEFSSDESQIFFVSSDGSISGCIDVDASVLYYPHMIDGKEESYYFEEINYAG